jgi:hypothetical protein
MAVCPKLPAVNVTALVICVPLANNVIVGLALTNVVVMIPAAFSRIEPAGTTNATVCAVVSLKLITRV